MPKAGSRLDRRVSEFSTDTPVREETLEPVDNSKVEPMLRQAAGELREHFKVMLSEPLPDEIEVLLGKLE